MRKKNILMLVNDHQAYYQHGWNGGVQPMRPNFERIAQAGTSFDRCYAVAPLCVPVRTTLLTGLYPHNHGNVCNDTHAPFNHELIFDPITNAGYTNYYFGKWHAGPGTATDWGPVGFSREDYGNPYISPEYRSYLKQNNLEMPKRVIEEVFYRKDFLIQHPDLVKGNREYISDKFFSGENAVGISLGPKETHESFFLAELACQALQAHKDANENDSPFFMRVDFWGPHHPHFPSREFAELYNPQLIEPYGSFDDDLSGRPANYKQAFRPIGDEAGELQYPNPLSKEQWQLICARAYAHITQVDAAGGKVLDMLEALGLDEDTIVIWTTDHGDALASHGGQWDKGSYMTEEVMRVPLAIKAPGIAQPGSICNALVNTVDIPETLVDFAQTAFTEPIDGRSLVPLCRNPDTAFRKDMLCETYGIGFGNFHKGKMLITHRYKYVWNENDIDELYDLEQDPYELRNLIASKDHGTILIDLRGRMLYWLEQTSGETEMVVRDLSSKGFNPTDK